MPHELGNLIETGRIEIFARVNLSQFLIAAILVAGMLLGQTIGAVAQDLPLQRDEKLQELQEIQAAISIGEERRAELVAEISRLDKDRVAINRSMIEASKKYRSIEKRVTKTEQRLSQLRDEQLEVRAFLQTKNALLTEVLAALQRMGRKPPPALLVSPEDALSSVRSAILLGSVVPEVRSETQVLIRQLNEFKRISDGISDQRAQLIAELTALADEEERLNLLLLEKQQLSGAAQSKLAQEQAKSAELAAKAGSLNELISDLETQIESVRLAEEKARKVEEQREKQNADRLAAVEKLGNDVFADSGRQAPAIPFLEAKGLLPVPVTATIATEFGSKDELGETVNGLHLLARPGAPVISPADGWIVYAGPFRTYGQLLIINVGSGYHVVLAGMNQINVKPGQFVIVGEPVGKMGETQIASAVGIDLDTTKPVLYVEFRKDGKPVDPMPWWADTNLQRVANGS